MYIFYVRAITFSPYLTHTEDLFRRLKIFAFKNLVIHGIGIQMFKYHKGMVSKAVCELLTLNSSNHSYNTRNKDKIRSAYGKHKFMYRNFKFISVHVWNYLASNIIINTSLADFKNKFKIFIMSNKFNLTFSLTLYLYILYFYLYYAHIFTLMVVLVLVIYHINEHKFTHCSL